jgi:hypothetical protein
MKWRMSIQQYAHECQEARGVWQRLSLFIRSLTLRYALRSRS